ncbi:restriction endonuclease subunit S [Aliarcobacter butzleri]|uniref:restriction endonuclease subunit S n=1 Tax=Aliarcobacter butzleri TaxID=28197 RepID=UPI002876E90B|nr:restriction endonuclease subunit S [Aliarcobacter butzleri]MDS1370200.1 restriction endonuclease subunit S [Aliarcobacter butzleri]
MSSWKEFKLGDIAKLSKKTWKVGDELMPYIGLEHIEESKLRLNSIGSSENVASNKFRFQAGDTLFGKLRPYFRKVIKPNFDGVCSTDIWVLNPQKGIDKDFLFYFFANQELVDISYSASSGTRMPRADWDFLSQTVWNIPSIEEQKAIAEVLSSLDDKIDLLHRQNQTLESIAQTLFRQWFIEEAKEEWEEKTLSYFGDIICGKTPSKSNSQYFDGNVPFIKIPDMHGNTFIFKTTDTLSEIGKESQKNKTLPPKSICVSCIATVGLVSMNIIESQTNQQINSIIPNKDIYRYFIYLFMQSSYDLLHAMASGGTATLNLNTGDFSKMEILKPDDETLKIFHQVIEPTFDKIFINSKQIQTLENLRDTLLPKLLSGEVRVKI